MPTAPRTLNSIRRGLPPSLQIVLGVFVSPDRRSADDTVVAELVVHRVRGGR